MNIWQILFSKNPVWKDLVLDNIIQLITFDEVNTRIDQPMEHDIHWGIRGWSILVFTEIESLTVLLLYDIKSNLN
jgi:hypothetical protein